VPDTLHALFRANPRLCYGLLFAAVAETLHDVAGNPKNLGATIGFSCVLHSWTQTLLFHPHIHCIVTGGGLDPDRRRWIAARRGFLFPVRILAQLFRAKLLRRLESGLNDKTLCSNDVDPHARLRAAACKDWVVYSKPPFAGPRQVLRYLGRYTHRVAISNHRRQPETAHDPRRAGVSPPLPAPHLAFRTDAHPTLRTARQLDTTRAPRTMPSTHRRNARTP
jgi:hypothetical protein